MNEGSEMSTSAMQTRLAVTLFMPIIQDNYYNDQRHFMFELDHVQTANLISKSSSCVLTLMLYWTQYTR